jgi:hypothetical protein
MRALLERLEATCEAKESPVKKAMNHYGIENPQKTHSTHSACSIGKSTKDGKWYGWSHRAICGFGVGDRIFEAGYGNDETLFRVHGKKPIKTDADAKLAATRFASYVS